MPNGTATLALEQLQYLKRCFMGINADGEPLGYDGTMEAVDKVFDILDPAIAEAKREDTASPERVLEKAFCDWCDRCWREREGCAWPQECEHSAFCIKLRASVQTLQEALMKTREPEAANGN